MSTILKVPEKQIVAATAALKRLGGTYLTKHAGIIALLALRVAGTEAAIAAVKTRVGATSVGAQNYRRWALEARLAAAEVGEWIDHEPKSRCD